jgi:hypothetical protein
MGGILRVAGIDGFLTNLDDLYDSDDAESTDIKRLLARWWEAYHDDPKPPGDLFGLAQEPDVALPLVGKDEHARRCAFGRYLTKHKARVHSITATVTVRLERANDRGSHHPLWRLRLLDSKAPRAGGGESRESWESRTPHATRARPPLFSTNTGDGATLAKPPTLPLASTGEWL